MLKFNLLLLSILTILSQTLFANFNNQNTLSKNIIKQYAPLIYLAQEEEFYPSSIEFFTNYTNLDLANNQFITKNQIDCPSCTNLDFFHGQQVTNNNVPIYTQVVPKPNIGNNITDVIYWTFYPYNRGKRVCLAPIYTNGNCWGKYGTFGHHVGDWEHVTIRFKNNTPIQVYLAQHNFGEIINWGDNKINYYNTHPVLYSANGSHGLYSTVGEHVYKKIFNGDKLADYTSKGQAWHTWENIKITYWKPIGNYTNNNSWLNFTGRYGNAKDGCEFMGINFEKLFQSCILNAGPISPSMRDYTDPYNANNDEFNL